jgi:hypothetical protein
VINRTYHPRGMFVDGFPVRQHPNYVVWVCMLRRCENKADPAYPNYGGRGISVCERWQHFRFFAEDMGVRPDPSLTIERIENDQDYRPGNCRWDTRSNQCVNRRKFKNNTSGETGVVPLKSGRYRAQFDYEGVRYGLGRFCDVESAASARHAFVELFFSSRDLAIASIPAEHIRYDSSTGVRGVTKHPDGGYLARCTIEGVRHYVGYFQDIQEAANERARFVEERTRRA